MKEGGGGEPRRRRCRVARRLGPAAGEGEWERGAGAHSGGEPGAGRPQRRCGEGGERNKRPPAAAAAAPRRGGRRRRALGGSVSAAPSALPLPGPDHEYVTPLYFPNSIAEAAARHIVLLGLRLRCRRERATGASGAVRRGGLRREPGGR